VYLCAEPERERERERRERRSTERTFVFFLFFSPSLLLFLPFRVVFKCSLLLLSRSRKFGESGPSQEKQAKKKEGKKEIFSSILGPVSWVGGRDQKKNRRKIEHHPFLFCSHSLSFKKPLFLCWDLQSTRTRALGKKIARARLSFDYLFLYSDRESVDSTEKLFFPRVRGKPRASFSLQTPKSKNKIYRSLFRCDTSSTVHHALLNAVASHRIARAMSRR